MLIIKEKKPKLKKKMIIDLNVKKITNFKKFLMKMCFVK